MIWYSCLQFSLVIYQAQLSMAIGLHGAPGQNAQSRAMEKAIRHANVLVQILNQPMVDHCVMVQTGKDKLEDVDMSLAQV